MKTEKDTAKTKVVPVVIIVLVVIALFVGMLFALKSCQDGQQIQGETSQTFPEEAEPSGNDPVETTAPVTDPAKENEPEETTKEDPTDTTKPANTTRPAGTSGSTGTSGDTADPGNTGGSGDGGETVNRDPLIYAESVTVSKGTGVVTMNIRIRNNPGILGAVLKVSVNDAVFAFREGAKSGYPGLTLTSPGPGATASPYTFMLDGLELSADDKKDGTLFTITFKIKDTTVTGRYDVKLSCDTGAIFNEKYDDLKIGLENGTITIQ